MQLKEKNRCRSEGVAKDTIWAKSYAIYDKKVQMRNFSIMAG